MGFDELINGDLRSTSNDSSSGPASTRCMGLESTEALATRRRVDAEAGLLYGLLAAAGGLVTPEALTRSLGAWARSPGRSLREVLVARGHLDESGASLVDALAAASLGRHGGSPREALTALGDTARFRIEADEVTDPRLRRLLAGLVEVREPVPGVAGFGKRYEVIRPHAHGGLGIISVARDHEIHREVVVKEIRNDYADDPDTQARFRREAEVTGRLEHPGIVPVYGIGYHDDGRPYYIMRFIRGETLMAAIARLHKAGDEDEAGPEGRGDLHSLVGRFIDACHAVAYAHHRKILHRDLKPINIMLGPFGETLVVDWGLAKSFDASRSGSSPVESDEDTLRPESGSGMTPTRYGSEVGTIGYMSPEQAEGRLTELGPTSDIYSLGVTLMILGTGRGPFEKLGKTEFLRKVSRGEFPKPSLLNPSIPPALEAICLKAMALRPVGRYQTVGELIDDLERWRAGQPVQAYPEPFIDRLSRTAGRHRTTLAGAAVLLVCTTFGLAAYAVNENQAREKEHQTNLLLAKARIKADRARVASEANRKSALGSWKATLREINGADLGFLAKPEELRDRMAKDLVRNYEDLLTNNPDDIRVKFDLAQACQLSANIGRQMGRLDPPRSLYARAIELLESLGDWSSGADTRIWLATVLDDAGENDRMAGKPEDAVAKYRRGLETLRRSAAWTNPGPGELALEGRLQLDLSGALKDLGQLGPAEEASRLAIDRLKPLASELPEARTERLLLIYALVLRGSALRLEGEFGEATVQLADAERRSRELMAAVTDPDTRFGFATVRAEQGLLLLETTPAHDRDAALAAFEESYAHVGPLSEKFARTIEFQRGLATTLNGRGVCRLDRGMIKEARADFTEARRLLDRLDATVSGHFDHLGQLGWALANLGRVSRAEGNAEDARQFLLKAAESHRAALLANRHSLFDKKRLNECQKELDKPTDEAGVLPPRP